jgi:hypothetical protein
MGIDAGWIDDAAPRWRLGDPSWNGGFTVKLTVVDA